MDTTNCSPDVAHNLLAAAGQHYCWNCGEALSYGVRAKERFKKVWNGMSSRKIRSITFFSAAALIALALGFVGGGVGGLKVAAFIETAILAVLLLIAGIVTLDS